MLARLWFLLEDSFVSSGDVLPRGATKERMLWGLYLVKSYPPNDETGASMCGGIDEKTYRKWAWWFIEELSYLETQLVSSQQSHYNFLPLFFFFWKQQTMLSFSFFSLNIILLLFCFILQIDWENRKVNDIGNDCLVSVDGVDCLYKTRKKADGKPDKSFYANKFKKSGMRYEVAVSIRSEHIVNIEGPYKPGMYNDLQIFRFGLRGMLEAGERVEGDLGYEADAPEYVKVPGELAGNHQKYMRKRLRKRHETVNRRIKVFKAVDTVFRQNMDKHGACFRVAAICVQLAMDLGQQQLFDVLEYDDNTTDDQAAQYYGA